MHRGIAPTNYLEAQNWLITTGRISSEAQSKLGGLWGACAGASAWANVQSEWISARAKSA